MVTAVKKTRKTSMYKLLQKLKNIFLAQPLLQSKMARNGLLIGVLFVFAGIAMGLLVTPDTSKSNNDQSKTHSLLLPGQTRTADNSSSLTKNISITESPETNTKVEIPVEPEPTNPQDEGWDIVVIKPGQTLDGIFRQRGYSVSLLHQILAFNAETKGLSKLRVGQQLLFKSNPDSSFSQLRVELGETRFITVSKDEVGISVADIYREVERRTEHATGSIQNSLFVAGKKAGLSDNMVMKLANIFGWDIDFVLDIRKNDSFSIIYQKLYRDGEFLRDGDILAATFSNQGDVYRSIRFGNEDSYSYFTPEGRNMKKSFLRAPLNFAYISSSFSPKRYHPVLKRVKAHRGIDYQAPRGTPVYAAGDGKVIRSAYSKYNGHHVFIQHANGIVTKYLHFTKRKVKNGQRVRQGQTIGTVGATGLASGPHLHYEFVINGVHRNPRTVKLPKADPLPADQLPKFKLVAEPLITQLKQLEQVHMLAAGEP